MSEDYQSGARSLALPVDSRPPRRSESPLWSRRPQDNDGDGDAMSYHDRILQHAAKAQRQAYNVYRQLTPLQRVLIAFAAVAGFVLSVLFLVYNERIFGWLAPVAQKWRDLRAGWLILFAATFVVSFPPLIGYSSCVTLAGFVYGFPNGFVVMSFSRLKDLRADRFLFTVGWLSHLLQSWARRLPSSSVGLSWQTMRNAWWRRTNASRRFLWCSNTMD